MAKKATITPVTDTVNNAAAINTQLNAINNKLENTLSLDGSVPNAMGADLDFNSNDLLNVGTLQATDITVAGDSLTGVLATTGANKDAAAASAVEAAASAVVSSANAASSAASAALSGDASGTTYTQGGTGSVETTVEAKLQETISVKDFGAVGDGVTDDTSPILAAATAAAATGSALEFPAGIYILSNSTWPTDINIRGAGMGRSVIRWKSGSASSNLIALSGVVNLIASDITFDGNRLNQTDSTGFYGSIGGTIDDGSRIIIERCEFINGRITDIILNGPVGSGEFVEVEITNCRFFDGLVGSATRSAQAVSVVEGIRLRASHNDLRQPTGGSLYGRGGIVMQRPGGSTSLSWGQYEAIGNSFENFGRQSGGALGCLYVYSGAELVAISNNRFKNSYGTAITVKADAGPTTIVGNVVDVNFSTTAAAITFFDQGDTYTSSIGRDLVIANNSVLNPELTSIFVDGSRAASSDFKNVVVTNNICDGGVRGVHIRNLETATLIGNIISNTSGVGVFGTDLVGDISISGNIINAGLVGMSLETPISGGRFDISGNQISDLTNVAIRLRASVESFQIKNNNIAGCGEAFETQGATEFSSVTGNTVRGSTGAWTKVGSYSGIQYNNNVTDVDVSFGARSLTIASDAITVHADWHSVDTEGAAATDDLSTINGGYEGRRLVLFSSSSTRDVTLKDGVGNLQLAGDFTLDRVEDTIELIFKASTWYELSRSNNV